jgi:hypothetical protein
MKTKLALLVLVTLVATATVLSLGDSQECSTLVASGAATADRAPLLWKNRDTDRLSNKVVFVEEQPFSYLALVNADDTHGRMAWAGVNSAGFAIANSVAYNLPLASGEQEDLEGIIMADALRTCSTIACFEQQLKRSLGPDLGSRANFLVIDARGGAAIFEVHNHGSTRLDAADSPEKYLVNTNFSRSGTEDQGAGYLRFDRETALLKTLPAGALSHEQILQIVSRDLGHALLRNPERADWKKLPPDIPSWIHTNYTINRPSTSAAIVFQGVRPGEDPQDDHVGDPRRAGDIDRGAVVGGSRHTAPGALGRQGRAALQGGASDQERAPPAEEPGAKGVPGPDPPRQQCGHRLASHHALG